jgi:hypothetical protein
MSSTNGSIAGLIGSPQPMPWRTDPVSLTACDRCPYADHAAVDTMQQGVQRRPIVKGEGVNPKSDRPSA